MSEVDSAAVASDGAQVQPVEVEVVDIIVQLPACVVRSSSAASSVTIPSTLNATLGELKQSLLVIHILRNFTSYDIYYHSHNLTKHFDDLFELDAIFEQTGISLSKSSEENGHRSVTLSLKEKPYTLSAVYQHLEKFRESIGLNYLDKNAFSAGTLGGVSKFNDLALADVKIEEKKPESVESEKKNSEETEAGAEATPAAAAESQPEPLSAEEKASLETVATTLLAASTTSLEDFASFKSPFGALKVPLKSLSISQWSPVPASQRVKGDLLYLTLQTLENETINVTANITGFFVNNCSIATFDPSLKYPQANQAGKIYKRFNLFDLVVDLSSLFSKTIQDNESTLTSFSANHPEAYLVPSNTFVAFPWCANEKSLAGSVKPDVSRSQLPLLYNGVDGSSNVKDWNEDIQSIKELSRATIDERILREQLLNKSTFEFTTVASETAMNIIRGDVPSINPQDEPERNVFLRNGVFYYMNVNDSGAFDESGGNEAARYTSGKDLSSIRVLNKLDLPGVSSLVTCIVDYMGRRVVCQAPVPGIFNNPVSKPDEDAEAAEEAANKVSYGLSVDRTKIYQDKEFEDALKPIAEALHIKPHDVSVGKSEANLVLSKDTKGIKGTDGRKYLMDLYRTTPLDVEFIDAHWTGEDKEDSYPHREAVLRHEAVEEWWKRKVSVLIKAETERLEKEKAANPASDDKENEEKPQLVIPSDQIVFNPDSFVTGNASVNSDDEGEVRELSKFIKEQLIPEFLRETASSIAPFDGSHLSKSLHNQGINLRYLGYIAEKAAEKKVEEEKAFEELVKTNRELVSKKQEEAEAKKVEAAKKAEESGDKDETKDADAEAEAETDAEAPQSAGKFEPSIANLETLVTVSIQEMVARASKHVLRSLSSRLPVYLVPHLVTHFHNCLLGSSTSDVPEHQILPEIIALSSDEDLEFTKLTPSEIIDLVRKEVSVRFRYTLPQKWETELVRPVQLFREIAIKYGIQWKAQEYAFTREQLDKLASTAKNASVNESASNGKKSKSKKKASPTHATAAASVARSATFVVSDIINFFPKIKDSTFKSTLLDEIYEAARVHIYKGETEVGLTLLNELLSFSEQIYGRVHPETTRFYGSIAQIYSELNLKFEACEFSRKACILSERTSGFDSFETVLAYINSSFYEGVNNDPLSSFKLYEKVLSDWDHVYGANHPSSINTITNLAESLSTHQLFDISNKLYQKVLEVSDKLNGPLSQVSGIIRYRFARSIFAAGDIQGSLDQFKKANEIFNLSIGPDDLYAKETNELVSKFEDHIKYTAQQKKNEQAQAQFAAAQQAQLAAATAAQQGSKAPAALAKKNGKKQQAPPKSDPAIASQSIDDILKFINGSNPTKKKTKKVAKK